MYPLYYKGLRLSVTFQVKHLCVGDFASFAKIFAGFYFGKGIVLINLFSFRPRFLESVGLRSQIFSSKIINN